MRLLLIDQATKDAVARVREHAERPERWFRPGPRAEWEKLQGSGQRPGDKPEHIVTLTDGFRCVFSWTVTECLNGAPIVVRDLAVSVPNAQPHPVLVFEIAELFGFTKREDGSDLFLPHPDWHVWLDDCRVPCVCLVELIPGAKP